MHVIQNDHLSIGVKQKGAELSSIKSLESGIEFMWCADPSYWGRHSCILFPVIGCVKDGQVKFGDRSYPMIKHGLVRDREWTLINERQDQLIFSFASDDETRRYYPFNFELKAVYSLVDSNCVVRYEVTTKGEDRIPFNIGAHPAFACPLVGNGIQKGNRNEYRLVFNESEYQNAAIITKDGLIGVDTHLVLDNQKELLLIDRLFDNDALIFDNLNSEQVSLVDKNNKVLWTFKFGNCPHLGIWSSGRSSPFVCIEPWYGVADAPDASGQYIDKPSIQWVGPDEVWSYEHTVIIGS